MSKKYELTDDTLQHNGHTLHRIRARVDIPASGVSVGDLGGYVESERNLSHDGSAWVGGDARVYGIAHVYGGAVVCGGALVSGRAKVCGSASVTGDAKVHGSSLVLGYAWVHGQVEVYDALVCGGELG